MRMLAFQRKVHRALVRLQAFARSCAARKKYRRILAAVRLLQRTSIGTIARRALRHRHASARVIQHAFRHYLVAGSQAANTATKLHTAAARIQAWVRCTFGVEHYEVKREYADGLQSHMRAYLAVRKRRSLLSTVVFIQSGLMRPWLARTRAQRRRDTILTLQGGFRCALARRKVARIHASSLRIVSWIREVLSRWRVTQRRDRAQTYIAAARRKYNDTARARKRKQIVLQLQATYRGSRLRRKLRVAPLLCAQR
jgi:hypothetical protein